MNKITVIGLGPGDSRFLTVEALEHLKNGKRLFIRTEKHPTNEHLKSLGIEFETFDELYESAQTFESVYEQIVDRLLLAAIDQPINYAVPGNPFVAEKTVELLKEKSEDIDFIYGVSFIDAVLSLLKLDPVDGFNIVDGLNIQRISNQTNNLVIQVYNKMVAADVKYKLSRFYPDDHELLVVQSAGVIDQEKVITRALCDLDRMDDYDHLTSLLVPPVKEDLRLKDFEDLVQIMQVLRGEDGCPWDRKQTHESLKKNLIEEAYEVLEAIDQNDSEHLEEELGDLLLQVVFHGLIEEETGYFNLDDVTHGLCEKLIRRHPHIFGDKVAQTPEDVEKIWNHVKSEEKTLGYTDRMNELSKSFPALIRAAKIQKIAREVGFDWDDVNPALDKVREEYSELIVEIENQDKKNMENELGDLLFAVVNVARFLKIDPEIALDLTIQKFVKRFSYIESSELALSRGMGSMSLEEMDLIWEESKLEIKSRKITKKH